MAVAQAQSFAPNDARAQLRQNRVAAKRKKAPKRGQVLGFDQSKRQRPTQAMASNEPRGMVTEFPGGKELGTTGAAVSSGVRAQAAGPHT